MDEKKIWWSGMLQIYQLRSHIQNSLKFHISQGIISGQVTGPSGLSGIGSSVRAHKIQQLPRTDQRMPDYTTNTIVSIDGKYVFNLLPGVYRLIVAFPDGTNHVINNYAVWPGTTRSLDFRY
jgi:hypothetical protein